MQCVPEAATEMLGSREVEQRLKVLSVEQEGTEASLRTRIRDGGHAKCLGHGVRSTESYCTDKSGH